MAQELPYLGATGRTVVSFEHSRTDEGVSLTETRAQAAIPFYKTEHSTWSASFKAYDLVLGDTLHLADRQFEIPKHFGGADIGLGANFQGDKRTQGFSASVGSTGRQLLDSSNSRAVSLVYFHEWKVAEDRSWHLVVNYSNNRANFNNIPLPGFAYSIQRPGLRLMAGLPFAFVFWMPRPWIVNAGVSPFGANAEGGYLISGPWQAMTGFSWQPRSFQNLAPNVNNERLLFDKKEWMAGLRAGFGPMNSISLAYVYQYDRRFFIGKGLSNRRSDAANLEDAGGVQLRFRASF